VFLVWAWVDSLKTMRTLRRDSAIGGRSGILALHADLIRMNDGRIFIQWCRPMLTDSTLKVRSFPVSYRRNGAARKEGIAMPKVHRFVIEEAKGVRVVRDVVEVPMWGVVGLYLMGCGDVLWWRRRKWRRFLLDGGASV